MGTPLRTEGCLDDGIYDINEEVAVSVGVDREAWILLDSHGRRPFLEWYEDLAGVRVRARVQTRIRRLEQGGIGDTKNLGDGVWEARIHFGAGWRIYFGFEEKSIILLLLSGSKRTQDADILKAKKIWRDYETGKTKERWANGTVVKDSGERAS
jgi:putative addiction module killer protein